MTERTGKHFTLISILNHWITAIVFIAILTLGFCLGYDVISGDAKGPLRGIHKAAGFLFLFWAFWRVGWRLFQGFPKDVAAMPLWQNIAAKAAHYLLLLAIITMPLSGTLMSLYNGYPINVFGLFTVAGFEKNKAIAGIAHEVHELAPWAITALIILHIAAALKHHILDKDATLTRMLGKKP